jgi:hypothetical protein
MTTSSLRLRRASVFAIVVALIPTAYLLIWLFGDPEALGSANVFLSLAAWGPAFPLWFIGLRTFPDGVRVALAVAGWLLVSFVVRYLVHRLWLAIAIVIFLAIFFSAVNFVLLIPYL